jgi:acetylornithine/succinyldiaminopimelate/putrescine aminotransferase
VIRTLVEEKVCDHVNHVGSLAMARLHAWRKTYPGLVVGVRGRGLLLLIQFSTERTAAAVTDLCFRNGLFVRQTQGTGILLFPALNITVEELDEGLAILERAIGEFSRKS